MFGLCFLLVALFFLASQVELHAEAQQGVANPEEYVNTLGGTKSRYDLSTGNLLPLVAVPWAFNSWAPVTDNDNNYPNWWFHPDNRRIFGIRCTHQPSPWVGDYGNFLIYPSINDPQHDGPGQFSGYNPSTITFKPYLFNASLIAYGTRAGYLNLELTSTSRASVMRLRYPPFISGPTCDGFNQTRRVMITLNNATADSLTLGTDSSGNPTNVANENTPCLESIH